MNPLDPTAARVIISRATVEATIANKTNKHKVADYIGTENQVARARQALGPDYVRTNNPSHDIDVGNLYRKATPVTIKNAVLSGNVQLSGDVKLDDATMDRLVARLQKQPTIRAQIQGGKNSRSRSTSVQPPPPPPGTLRERNKDQPGYVPTRQRDTSEARKGFLQARAARGKQTGSPSVERPIPAGDPIPPGGPVEEKSDVGDPVVPRPSVMSPPPAARPVPKNVPVHEPVFPTVDFIDPKHMQLIDAYSDALAAKGFIHNNAEDARDAAGLARNHEDNTMAHFVDPLSYVQALQPTGDDKALDVSVRADAIRRKMGSYGDKPFWNPEDGHLQYADLDSPSGDPQDPRRLQGMKWLGRKHGKTPVQSAKPLDEISAQEHDVAVASTPEPQRARRSALLAIGDPVMHNFLSTVKKLQDKYEVLNADGADPSELAEHRAQLGIAERIAASYHHLGREETEKAFEQGTLPTIDELGGPGIGALIALENSNKRDEQLANELSHSIANHGASPQAKAQVALRDNIIASLTSDAAAKHEATQRATQVMREAQAGLSPAAIRAGLDQPLKKKRQVTLDREQIAHIEKSASKEVEEQKLNPKKRRRGARRGVPLGTIAETEPARVRGLSKTGRTTSTMRDMRPRYDPLADKLIPHPMYEGTSAKGIMVADPSTYVDVASPRRKLTHEKLWINFGRPTKPISAARKAAILKQRTEIHEMMKKAPPWGGTRQMPLDKLKKAAAKLVYARLDVMPKLGDMSADEKAELASMGPHKSDTAPRKRKLVKAMAEKAAKEIWTLRRLAERARTQGDDKWEVHLRKANFIADTWHHVLGDPLVRKAAYKGDPIVIAESKKYFQVRGLHAYVKKFKKAGNDEIANIGQGGEDRLSEYLWKAVQKVANANPQSPDDFAEQVIAQIPMDQIIAKGKPIGDETIIAVNELVRGFVINSPYARRIGRRPVRRDATVAKAAAVHRGERTMQALEDDLEPTDGSQAESLSGQIDEATRVMNEVASDIISKSDRAHAGRNRHHDSLITNAGEHDIHSTNFSATGGVDAAHFVDGLKPNEYRAPQGARLNSALLWDLQDSIAQLKRDGADYPLVQTLVRELEDLEHPDQALNTTSKMFDANTRKGLWHHGDKADAIREFAFTCDAWETRANKLLSSVEAAQGVPASSKSVSRPPGPPARPIADYKAQVGDYVTINNQTAPGREQYSRILVRARVVSREQGRGARLEAAGKQFSVGHEVAARFQPWGRHHSHMRQRPMQPPTSWAGTWLGSRGTWWRSSKKTINTRTSTTTAA